ncbi:MAG: HAD-IG family 5'-nucleotidase [Planctomycetes bacterium]|nr:HAD-IG family 5'-nucleotidase [Planctomycetota bacterium]
MSTSPPSDRDDQPATPWWFELVNTALLNPVLDRRRTVFTNRSLRFERVKAVGFDFDHTLALYNCPALDGLAMKMVIERLVREEGYPVDFADGLPDAQFACKGLIVDIEMGNVCKIDRFGHVVHAYHGQERLGQAERRRLYGDADHIPHVTHKDRFVQVDSAFAKPEVLIFSALAPRVAAEGKSCKALWKTIRHHTDMIHRDGTLKEVLMADPAAYLSPDPEIIAMLRHLRAGGKRVFLLTNSEWSYTRAMMNTALGLPGGADDLGWVELFDFVVCEAKKPSFFLSRTPQPMTATAEHPKVYCGGNIDELEQRVGSAGLEILYVGDHIYADLITSKRSSHWRTMLVISELEEELEVHEDLPGFARQLRDVDLHRAQTDLEVHHWQSLERVLRKLETDDQQLLIESLIGQCVRQRDRARKALRQYIRQRESLRTRISEAINPYWGSLFRAGSELTYYGKQLEDFACTYTGRASNLTLYPRDFYFRSGFDHLPHELESM